MENEIWESRFLEALYAKYPKRSQLVEALMRLLDIEREAVYRRLRKDVSFTIKEVAKISAEWNISLDGITGISLGKIPFFMHRVNYISPSEQEVDFLQHIIQSINYFKDFSDTEFMNICNVLPRQLIAGFKYLNRFQLFKCMYQYGNEKTAVPYSQVDISERMRSVTDEYFQSIKNVPQTNFILDRMIFDDLVREIKYFHSIQMITNKEKKLIKTDLLALLEYISEIATHGCYPETQKKVNIYISHLNVDTNYSFTYTHQISICFVHVFNKFEIYTYDTEMVTNFIKWMQLKKRLSVQISEVDNKSRIEFFTKQLQTINML